MQDNILKIKNYIDKRSILSRIEKEYIKNYLTSHDKFKDYSYEALRHFVSGYVSVLIAQRLLCIENDCMNKQLH